MPEVARGAEALPLLTLILNNEAIATSSNKTIDTPTYDLIETEDTMILFVFLLIQDVTNGTLLYIFKMLL